MRESEVESALKRACLQANGRSYKWISPGQTGVPDQVVLKPIPAEHQTLVSRYIRFVELKAPNQTPRARQTRVHDELRQLGFTVDVADTCWAAEKLMERM